MKTKHVNFQMEIPKGKYCYLKETDPKFAKKNIICPQFIIIYIDGNKSIKNIIADCSLSMKPIKLADYAWTKPEECLCLEDSADEKEKVIELVNEIIEPDDNKRKITMGHNLSISIKSNIDYPNLVRPITLTLNDVFINLDYTEKDNPPTVNITGTFQEMIS